MEPRIAAAPEAVQEILADGHVSFAELEAAALAAVACMEQQGIEVIDFSHVGMQFTYTSPEDSPTGQMRTDSASGVCIGQNYSLVAEAFWWSNPQTEAELAEQIDEMLACVRAAGYQVATYEEALALEGDGGWAMARCGQAGNEAYQQRKLERASRQQP